VVTQHSAEEFGFGTIALIAEGCIMARICHTNKCPVGGLNHSSRLKNHIIKLFNAVTTQNEALRKRFPGTPENVVTFFGYVAEEVRQILARLGSINWLCLLKCTLFKFLIYRISKVG